MSALWTAQEAAIATVGTAAGTWTATGVAIDSRQCAPGDLFIALTGARDGHDFVADALARGAVAAMVSREVPGVPPARLLLVPDVGAGLRALGCAGRARARARVVAVTGSVGKTGTKEMLRVALEGQGQVHAAERSFNNHWGVPLTLARLPREADFAVIEIGMNAPGEIAPLARIARPHVVMITTIAPVHIGAFDNLRGIAREKAAICAGLEPGGVAVLPRDAPHYDVLLRRAKAARARVLHFGASGRPAFWQRDLRLCDGASVVQARVPGGDLVFKLRATGAHLAMNALGVLACVHALGLDVPRAALALAHWRPPAGRGKRWQVALGPGGMDGHITLIDESYNANPASMEAALQVLALVPVADGVGRVARGRRIAILGDMRELGAGSAQMHIALADLPALAQVDLVHTVGSQMRALHESLPRGRRGLHFADTPALAARLRKMIDAGDVVMIKGSNGLGLAKAVDVIRDLGQSSALDATEGG